MQLHISKMHANWLVNLLIGIQIPYALHEMYCIGVLVYVIHISSLLHLQTMGGMNLTGLWIFYDLGSSALVYMPGDVTVYVNLC